MKNENFTVEILRGPIKGINRAEWTGSGRIPEVVAWLSPKAFLAVYSPADFKGRIQTSGDIEHYEKDQNKWTYRWSETARANRSGRGSLVFKHENPEVADINVSVEMAPAESTIFIKGPSITAGHIAAVCAIGFIAGLLLLSFFHY